MSEYRVDGLSRGSGFIIQGIGGEAVPRYSLVYLSGSNAWSLADASAAATLPVVGLAVEPLTTGQNGRILLRGVVNNNTWAWTPGDVLYVSDTAGALTNVAGTVEFEVGVAITATEILFNPQITPGAGGGANTIEVSKNSGAVVGTRPELNFIEGANITLTIADDAVNDEVDITIAAAGGGGVSASTTRTVTAGNLTCGGWNHAQNTSDVTCTPLDEPESFWWLTIDDANNVTVHIASADLQNNHTFRVLVF